MANKSLDELAVDAINALDAFRKAVISEGFPNLAIACVRLSNVLEDWLVAYREHQKKPPRDNVRPMKGAKL